MRRGPGWVSEPGHGLEKGRFKQGARTARPGEELSPAPTWAGAGSYRCFQRGLLSRGQDPRATFCVRIARFEECKFGTSGSPHGCSADEQYRRRPLLRQRAPRGSARQGLTGGWRICHCTFLQPVNTQCSAAAMRPQAEGLPPLTIPEASAGPCAPAGC